MSNNRRRSYTHNYRYKSGVILLIYCSVAINAHRYAANAIRLEYIGWQSANGICWIYTQSHKNRKKICWTYTIFQCRKSKSFIRKSISIEAMNMKLNLNFSMALVFPLGAIHNIDTDWFLIILIKIAILIQFFHRNDKNVQMHRNNRWKKKMVSFVVIFDALSFIHLFFRFW